jgi:hypothetical protein
LIKTIKHTVIPDGDKPFRGSNRWTKSKLFEMTRSKLGYVTVIKMLLFGFLKTDDRAMIFTDFTMNGIPFGLGIDSPDIPT